MANTNTITVTDNGRPFTQFIFPDSLQKPVLYPIYAPDGNLVTRGYPIEPRAGEPIDHPHHVGLWMNFENVNGIDFWNNSFAVPGDKKALYGSIRVTGEAWIQSGDHGIIEYQAEWVNVKQEVLIQELTTYILGANSEERVIDRITTLTAGRDIVFKDAKDGFFGLRVAHPLEQPSKETRQFLDDKGNITTVPATLYVNVTGKYITSEGKLGDSAWGTRAVWCMLYGKLKQDTISIVMIDHPMNPGYPTYWHARGYGLFAANPLGQKVFSNGKEELNLKIEKGKSVTFRYRVVIASGKNALATDQVNQLSKDFGN